MPVKLRVRLLKKDFAGFERKVVPNLSKFVMLTRYQASIDAPVAYMPEELKNSLGEYLSSLGKTQLRIAETEKYAHVTFFFSGGREDEYPGEKRILIPSPNVATYDLKPEMSAYEVTDELVKAINSGEYDLLVVNYANGDMVGHTGVFDAAVKAVEAVDTCLGRVYEAVMAKKAICLLRLTTVMLNKCKIMKVVRFILSIQQSLCLYLCGSNPSNDCRRWRAC